MKDSNTKTMTDISDTLTDTSIEEYTPFDHDRFEILGVIDRGCWGIAYDVRDLITDSLMVAKDYDPTQTARRQLKERKLTLNGVIKNEYTEMRTPDGIVPTWIEKDKNGKLFLIMPKYECNFETKISRKDYKRKLNSGLSLEEITLWCNDISTSISGYHKEYNEAHCDIKPENIFIDKKGKLWLGDSGTSTGTSQLSSDELRSNMGFMYTRAPENFHKDARPDKSSDVWSFGSLMYRMFTGKYFLEDELNNAVDPAKYMTGLDGKMAKALINSKLKDVPKEYRKFLGKCLSFEHYGRDSRYSDGISMKKAWEETIADLNPMHFWAKQVKKYVVPAIAGGILAVGIFYGSKLEPTKVDMPKSVLYGQMEMSEGLSKDHLVFERDTMPAEIKDVISDGSMNLSSKNLKMYTNNMFVGQLLRAYHITMMERGLLKGDMVTDAQHQAYMAYTSTDERQFSRGYEPLRIIAKSLEVAIGKSQTPRGTIDLEDVYAISRFGEEKVNMARRISGSFDYKEYSKAKDVTGNYIFPIDEQKFLMDILSRLNLEK